MYFLTDETVDTDEYMCHQTRPVLLPTGWADIPDTCTKFSGFFSKGGGLFLRGGKMVSHGDSTVKWAKIRASDNRVETSVDSQWVT